MLGNHMKQAAHAVVVKLHVLQYAIKHAEVVSEPIFPNIQFPAHHYECA